jgi:hypothetical protein
VVQREHLPEKLELSERPPGILEASRQERVVPRTDELEEHQDRYRMRFHQGPFSGVQLL